ncbi:MAG: hypothetical protein M1821_005575 [Bathelium mastoideum]|nr:MAG: hypothetical protein M1821_005575 [Bathelium mastoideum]
MGDIYMNAVVVLSADAGRSIHTGFLSQRDHASVAIRIPPWKSGHHEVDRTIYDIGTGDFSQLVRKLDRVYDDHDRVFARPHSVDIPLRDQYDDHNSFWSDPIRERAWCFQEQRLATRVVHFSKNEMYWECGSRSTCECGKLGSTDYGDDPALLARYFNSVQSLHQGNMQAPNKIDFWWSLVQAFSARKLTKVTDRLPAIAGLAIKMQSNELGEYYAGLWGGDLPRSLLWKTDDLTDDQNKAWVPQTYIGPTWSWISLMGQIEGPEFLYNRKVVAKIRGIRCQPDSTNVFGRIASASITLTAPMKTDVIEPTDVKYTDGFILQSVKLRSEGKILENLFLDIPLNRTPGEILTPYLGKVRRLIIARNDKGDHWEGLVLIKSTRQGGAFERIGRVNIYGKNRGRGWRQKTVTII